jgi:hypothetical protein
MNSWERVLQLRRQAFEATPGSHLDRSPALPMSSKSSAERNELKMWMAIDRCEQALDRLVKELEELMSIRAAGDAYMKNLQRDQNDHR